MDETRGTSAVVVAAKGERPAVANEPGEASPRGEGVRSR